MLRVAMKSALAKKLRLFSTALSVMLGVAFLAGTLVFTDTIQRTFDNLFASVFENTDTYVRSATSVDLEMGGSQRGRLPESVVATVRGVDGVADAQALVQGFAQLVDAHGKAIGDPGRGAPTFGMSYGSGVMSPWNLTGGSRAPDPNELVVDKGSADKGHLRIGDTVTVLTQTGPHEFLLVGIARFGTIDSPGGASIALFDLATAQQMLVGHTGEIDAIMVAATNGLSETQLTARIAKVLPPDAEALTGSEITAEAQNDMKEGLNFFSTFLRCSQPSASWSPASPSTTRFRSSSPSGSGRWLSCGRSVRRPGRFFTPSSSKPCSLAYWPRCSDWSPVSAWPAGSSRCWPRSVSTSPPAARCSPRAPRSWPLSSAWWSPSARPCSRRGARRVCRPSPPSATSLWISAASRGAVS